MPIASNVQVDRAAQRSRVWFTIAIAIGAVVVSGFGMWWARTKSPPGPILKVLTYSGHDYSPAASPDGKTIAFTSDRDGRPRIWLKTLSSGSETALSSGPDDYARFSPDGSTILFSRTESSLTSLYKMPVAGGEPMKVADDILDGDWSPDGRRIAFVRLKPKEAQASAAIWVVGAGGDGAAQIAQLENGTLHEPRWSPDGRTIAAVQNPIQAGSPSSIFVVDVDSKKSRTIGATAGGFAILSIAWTGSGDDLLYSQAESVSVTGAAGRIIRQNLSSGGTETVFWSPYASLIFDIAGPGTIVFGTGSPRQNVREVALQGGNAQSRRLTHGSSTDRQPAWSPDGTWVIFSSNQSGNLDIWEVSTTTGAERRLTDDQAEDWDPAFSADGKSILWSSNRSGHFEIWIAGADGSGARQLTQDGVDAENPTATSDGWIVYSSGNPSKNGVWKVRQDGSQATKLVAGPTLVPDVSPDGQYCLYVPNLPGKRYSVKVVRIADGSPVSFEISSEVFPRARWMPGGKAIAFIAQDEKGVRGVYVQDFVPGQDTASTRKPLGGFDPESTAESFGISPDGTRMAIASREQLSGLMMAERVPGVSRVPANK